MRILITSDTHYGFSKRTEPILTHLTNELKKQITKHGCSALIHAGDWITNDQHQLEFALKQFRDKIDIPILTVCGNHDFWNPQTFRALTIPQIIKYHKSVFDHFDIQNLEDGPAQIETTSFYGFSGWYNHSSPPSNDSNWMPFMTENAQTHTWMQYRALKGMKKLPTEKTGKSVLVTHFGPPLGPDCWEEMCGPPSLLKTVPDLFDVFIIGHSHQQVDMKIQNCRTVNPGGDYDKPRFMMIEI